MFRLECTIPIKLSATTEYVLSILADRLGIEFDSNKEDVSSIVFKYGEKAIEFPAYFAILEEKCFFEEVNEFKYELLLFEFKKSTYWGLYPKSYRNKLTSEDKYDIDIIGTIFVLLSRYEEYILSNNSRDKYDRFLPTKAVNFNQLNKPIVDELIELFKLIIEREFNVQVKSPTRQFSILPSHDVDRPFEYLFYNKRHLSKRLIGDILRRKSFSLARRRTTCYWNVQNGNLNEDPFNTFDWIIDKSKKYNRVSTFHFLVDVTKPEFDADYDINNPAITKLLKKINSNDQKIGLHPSFNASEISGQVKKEHLKLKNICHQLGINQNSFKNRYHYLRWNNESIPELEKAGIGIDQSLTYAQIPGFRSGTSQSYNAFNFQSMSVSDLIIEPLIIMEQSLISSSYMGLRNDLPSAWNIVQNLKDQCKKYSGTFTTLWHNNLLVDDDLREFYEECIK